MNLLGDILKLTIGHLFDRCEFVARPFQGENQLLALVEARVSQVEAELRLILVEAQASRLEERLSHLEAELADVRTQRARSPSIPSTPV